MKYLYKDNLPGSPDKHTQLIDSYYNISDQMQLIILYHQTFLTIYSEL